MLKEIAEPIEVTEIVGGRYDGAYLVRAGCPGCGGTVVHILDAHDYGSHRGADCENRCRYGYTVVRPMTGLMDRPFRWWEPASGSLGFDSGEGPGLLTAYRD